MTTYEGTTIPRSHTSLALEHLGNALEELGKEIADDHNTIRTYKRGSWQHENRAYFQDILKRKKAIFNELNRQRQLLFDMI